MKAILLAGGRGTRLRPLTLNTPKPIVPIFNRPFLRYQLDLLRQIPDIDEVILSLNYQPGRIEDLLGDGRALGVKLRYVVEPMPLGTAGAVKYARQYLDGTVVVFNGDVLTQIDLSAVLRLHRERAARATIVLTPVDNPSAYGVVENRFRQQRSAVPRKTHAPREFLQDDQCRHLRHRARHARPHSERHAVVHRAKFFSLPRGARGTLRRLRVPWLLDRHRHADQIPTGASRHHGWSVPGRALRRSLRRVDRRGRVGHHCR